MRPPLALTDSQLVAVREAAENIPIRWRSRFLAGVSEALMEREKINDADVHHACGHIQRMMMLGSGGEPLLDEGDYDDCC
jgi:hypothetical protein